MSLRSECNEPIGLAEPVGWIDRVHLYTELDEEPWIDNTLVLAEVRHQKSLAAGESYTETITVTLSPSATGQHILIFTDAPELVEREDEPRDRVRESNEDNNQLATDTDVRPVPADLVVTEVVLQPENFSGEKTVIQYTVTNMGDYLCRQQWHLPIRQQLACSYPCTIHKDQPK